MPRPVRRDSATKIGRAVAAWNCGKTRSDSGGRVAELLLHRSRVRRAEGESGNAYGTHIDVANGFRPVRNRANGWMIDRQIQKTETYSGVDGINQQDRAVQESMGRIVDRSREHLGPADKAVIATRKLLQQAMDVGAKGGDPAGTRRPVGSG